MRFAIPCLRGQRTVGTSGWLMDGQTYLSDYFHALQDLAKYNVLSIQPRSLDKGDELWRVGRWSLTTRIEFRHARIENLVRGRH